MGARPCGWGGVGAGCAVRRDGGRSVGADGLLVISGFYFFRLRGAEGRLPANQHKKRHMRLIADWFDVARPGVRVAAVCRCWKTPLIQIALQHSAVELCG